MMDTKEEKTEKKTAIDLLDRKLLSALEENARIATTELSRKCRSSRSVIEYRLKRLQEKDVVKGFHCLADPAKFGLTVWKVWVSLHALKKSQRNEFFSYLQTHDRVWWFGECVGLYDAVICVLTKNAHELDTFLKQTNKKFSSYIRDVAVLINVSFSFYTRGYLLNKPSKLIGTSFQESPEPKNLSRTSLHLLELLCGNSRITYAELAKTLKKDVKTIRKSIKDLKNSGVVVYYRPLIDPAKLGMEYYKVLLYMQNHGGGVLPSVMSFFQEQKNTVGVISCVGPWQLELEIEIDTYRNLCTMLSEVKDLFPDIVRYETLLITREGSGDLDLGKRVQKIL